MVIVHIFMLRVEIILHVLNVRSENKKGTNVTNFTCLPGVRKLK